MKLLYVYSVLFCESFQYRRLVKLLSAAEFFYNTGLLKLSLEFLQSLLNVLAFFNRYYNHFCY